MKKKIAFLLLITLLVCSAPGWANVSDATSLMQEKSVSLFKDIGGIPMDTIGLVASTLWATGEILIFPFRWMTKPFRHKSPY